MINDILTFVQNGSLAEVVATLSALVVAVSNVLTLFIDDAKVDGWLKYPVKILNWLSLNVGNNKNKNDK